MLVAMMLGAAALVRMVESANLLSGNLAFKRAATLAAEAGTEAAIGWLEQQDDAVLAQDHAELGYYANDASGFDAAGNRAGSQRTAVDWQLDNCAGATLARCLKPAGLVTTDAAGHTVRYVIQRLCAAPGPYSVAANCASHLPTDEDSSSRGGFSYGRDKRFAGVPLAYYRITARASGPRRTTSLVEILVRY